MFATTAGAAVSNAAAAACRGRFASARGSRATRASGVICRRRARLPAYRAVSVENCAPAEVHEAESKVTRTFSWPPRCDYRPVPLGRAGRFEAASLLTPHLYRHLYLTTFRVAEWRLRGSLQGSSDHLQPRGNQRNHRMGRNGETLPDSVRSPYVLCCLPSALGDEMQGVDRGCANGR